MRLILKKTVMLLLAVLLLPIGSCAATRSVSLPCNKKKGLRVGGIQA